MSWLTDDKKYRYINREPGACPNCGSTNIDGSDFWQSHTQAYQTITCNSCGKKWDDVYKLIDIEGVE